MDCKEAQILLAPHIMGDLDSDSRSHELQAHLFSCQACSQEYKAIKETMEFIDEHKALFAEAFETTDKKKAAEQEEIKLNWQGIQAKLANIEAKEKQAKFHRMVVRVSAAAAACLVVGISVFLTYSIYSKPKVVLTPSVRIELASDNGNIFIPTDRQIVSCDELKTLIIEGKYRIVMNTNTILAVESLRENSNTGCLVKLVSGRIYTHVEHEGNPFVVDTVHGKAVVTGTTFDVKVTDNSTTLVVTEGTVQFESEKGAVKVTAGQTSKIIGKSAPSIPLSCNTAELTAWATGYTPEDSLARTEHLQGTYDITDLPLSLAPEPIILEETDYDHWIEEKRDWFEREFPWIFRLKEALAKEGIKVDYPELLVQSGDIRQFVYPQVSPRRIPIPNGDSLLKAASKYGFDEQWLLKNVHPARRSIHSTEFVGDRFTGLRAFKEWADCFERAGRLSMQLDSTTLLYSLHSCSYLSNTRTLAWLRIYNVSQQENHTKMLALLHSNINVVNSLRGRIIKLLIASHNSSCEEYQELAGKVSDDISAIMTLEGRISAYEHGQ